MRVATASFFLLAAQLALLYLVEAQEAVEVAPYTVIKEAQGYEERAYPASSWVCYNSIVEDPAMTVNSYWPLFGYMSGGNSDSVLIPMTSPVTVKSDEAAQAGSWNTQMCFYLPKAIQQNPPKPLSDDVQLENRPAMTVFTRQTGGNMTDEMWMSLANELRTILESAEPSADLSTFYIAPYDPPSKSANRRNEVWFRKV